MIMQYISSQGTKFELYDAVVKVSSGSFHRRRWKLASRKLNYGEKIISAEKDPAEYELVFTIRGPLNQRKEYCNRLAAAAEYDIRNLSEGRLIYGDYSIGCLVTESDTGISSSRPNRTDVRMIFHCPYPFWSRTEKYSFPKIIDHADSTGMDYPYDYPYDYASRKSGRISLQNNAHYKSHFRMTIWGPVNNPSVEIGGHTYGINGQIIAGERIEIDSRKKSILKIGSKISVNWFGKRRKEESVFEEIPAGNNSVSWDGTFGFDLVLNDERSEPPWVCEYDEVVEILLADSAGNMLVSADGLNLEVAQ